MVKGQPLCYVITTAEDAPSYRLLICRVNESEEEPVLPTDGFVRAGLVEHAALNLEPDPLPATRQRHKYGVGPFAKLRMPRLPNQPGLYLWEEDGEVVYVGQTRTPLSERLGSRGYATISNYNTFARQPKRYNGGQQTNCRVNALANQSLASGHTLVIWCRTTSAELAKEEEAAWMQLFGLPPWNRRDERSRGS